MGQQTAPATPETEAGRIMARFSVLRPVLEDEVPLSRAPAFRVGLPSAGWPDTGSTAWRALSACLDPTLAPDEPQPTSSA